MCLDTDVLKQVETYMIQPFISGIDLDVRLVYSNNRDGSRDYTVRIGVLFANRCLSEIIESGYYDPDEISETDNVGNRYFGYVQELLKNRTKGLRWEVNTKRFLTLRLTRSGKPEDVKIVSDVA